MNYFMSLDPLALFRSMPGAFAQGMVWGLMALGVYITYRLLDFADLTVDGSLATGGAVAVMLIRGGMSPWAALIFAFLAGMAAGFITGILHTALGIPGILASILTQISLYSINLNIMGCSNQAVSVDKYPLVVGLAPLPVRLQQHPCTDFCDMHPVLFCNRCDSLLVFRHGAGTCHPRNRM